VLQYAATNVLLLQSLSMYVQFFTFINIPLSLSTCLNSSLTIFHSDPCVLPIQIPVPDQPVLLATFPLGPFLCLHLLLGTLYLHTFVLSIPYPQG